MDIDISEIKNRIEGHFGLGHRTLFWEDEPGEYAEVVESIELKEGSLVNATGAELAAKRALLRDRPARNVVVYRAGEKPVPEDDFLYDVKLSSTPFSCRMENVWAGECGVPAELAGELAEHTRFFNSKERRARLAESALNKSTAKGLRLAMLASCAGSKADNPRDAVRDAVGRLLVELGRGQAKTMNLIVECGLAQTLWSEVESAFGYSAPAGANPSVEDMALGMIKARCGDLVSDSTASLGADASKILGDIAASGRTRSSFDALVRDFGDAIAEAISPGARTMESIGTNDTLPVFDDWIVSDMLSRALFGALRPEEADGEINMRRHTLWFEEREPQYAAIAAAVDTLSRIDSYFASCTAKTTQKAIFDTYCAEWYRIDEGYRHFIAAMRLSSSRFGQMAKRLVGKVNDTYGKFLVDLTDRWQIHLMDSGSYPSDAVPAQSSFFYEKVEKSFPKAEDGRRVGVIVSDALRYEVGAELASRINKGEFAAIRGRAKASCEAMASMLPSYTQLGMAALLPRGSMEIVPDTENVLKGGSPTNGLTNRQKITEVAVPGALLLQASEVLESGLPKIDDAPLVVVYHNAIDKRGDSRDTEGEVFAACEDAIDQVAKVAGELLRAGCCKILVTSDHGFLYQDQPVEEFNYAVVNGLSDLAGADGKPLSHSRRYAIGRQLPECEALMEYSAADLSLEGEYRVALPRGIARLRLRGSGARYVHGGASLQENVVPVVSIEPAKRSQGVARTGVQGFLCGRATITGSTVALDVYQTEPCSDKVAPLTVKVGLYDPDDGARALCSSEHTLELASAATASEDRKTRVELHVTDDVDDCAAAVLRISSRVGNTNQFKPEWEQRLSVNRAFGNDFDF